MGWFEAIVWVAMAFAVWSIIASRLVPRRSLDEVMRDRDEWRAASLILKDQFEITKAEMNQALSGIRQQVVAPTPKCPHDEVEDVVTPALLGEPGEVVARICTNPECYEQLPADFEPPKERPTYGWPDPEPLKSPAEASNVIPLMPYPLKPGQTDYDSASGITRIWTGDHWETLTRKQVVEMNMANLPDLPWDRW